MYPLTPFPALLIEGKKRLLVIADLHIGWEISLAQQGIHIPSQVNHLITKTLKSLEKSHADELLILGDVKHTVVRIEPREWQDVPFYFERILENIKSVSVIPGNHDGNLAALIPSNVTLLSSTGVSIDNSLFLHGHKYPLPSLLLNCTRIIMGHMHPMIMLKDKTDTATMQQIWVKTPCNREQLSNLLKKRFKKVKLTSIPQLSCTILPSFNDFLGGKAVNINEYKRKYIGPLIRSGVINLNEAEIFLLDGVYLGKIMQFKASKTKNEITHVR
jgi:putative SbcD/Mre11-related phosphoesterase